MLLVINGRCHNPHCCQRSSSRGFTESVRFRAGQGPSFLDTHRQGRAQAAGACLRYPAGMFSADGFKFDLFRDIDRLLYGRLYRD